MGATEKTILAKFLERYSSDREERGGFFCSFCAVFWIVSLVRRGSKRWRGRMSRSISYGMDDMAQVWVSTEGPGEVTLYVLLDWRLGARWCCAK